MFVGGVPTDMPEETIREYFEQFGPVRLLLTTVVYNVLYTNALAIALFGGSLQLLDIMHDNYCKSMYWVSFYV